MGADAGTGAAAAESDGFDSLFAFLPIGAYRSLPDGRQLRANPALVRLNGYASEAEQLAAVRDIATEWYVDPARREAFAQALQAHGQVIGFESEIHRHKTRERIWVSENAHAVRGPDGAIRFYEGTVEDITARKLAQQALLRSEKTLRATAARLPGVVFRVLHDDAGGRRVDYISEGITALCGLTPQQLLDDGDAFARLRHPEDRGRVDAAIRAATACDGPLSIEYRLQLADDSTRWVRHQSSGEPEDGRHVRVGVILDITESRQAQAALLRTSQLWKLALEATGDGVWDWNLLTGQEQLSPQCLALYGYAPGELEPLARELDSRTHPDDVPAMNAARQAHLQGRTPSYVNEHRVRCRDGRWKWVLSRGMVIERDGDGRPLRMVGTHTDIDERKHAEALRAERDAAAAADRAKTLFLSRVSHELRTPLNAILGFAQLLELQQAGPVAGADAAQREQAWVQQILLAGRHLLGLMDDILDLSSAQTGQMALALQPVAPAEAVQQACAMLAGAARDAAVQLHDATAQAALPAVRADRRRLTQVLSNLLSNAVKYNRPGGWVRVQGQVLDDGRVELSVADSGPGLTPAQQTRLFQPFERLGAQAGAVQGSGLGLALSRQLVQAMGGDLCVDSQPGQGSSFRVRLAAA